ncbi:hypothetical protein RRG08_048246 [Elysia crispata]|uniref:Uncharacterized protein n=1 Tax=Elysia crispata TaxID=231223 RepID=A0AAE1B4H1_9GAST|nr:hypothetical protein RRG08_048246 [Elysia crispata]
MSVGAQTKIELAEVEDESTQVIATSTTMEHGLTEVKDKSTETENESRETNSTSKKIVKKAIKYGSQWRRKYQNERASVQQQKIQAKIMQNKRERELKDIKMKERSLKALDAIIGELHVIDSKEELDQVYNGPNAVERLKDQIRFRSLVRVLKQPAVQTSPKVTSKSASTPHGGVSSDTGSSYSNATYNNCIYGTASSDTGYITNQTNTKPDESSSTATRSAASTERLACADQFIEFQAIRLSPKDLLKLLGFIEDS